MKEKKPKSNKEENLICSKNDNNDDVKFADTSENSSKVLLQKSKTPRTGEYNQNNKIMLDVDGKYIYSDLTYENLLENSLLFKDDITFKTNKFQYFLYINESINIKTVIDGTNEVDFYTNFLLTNKIITLNCFYKL